MVDIGSRIAMPSATPLSSCIFSAVASLNLKWFILNFILSIFGTFNICFCRRTFSRIAIAVGPELKRADNGRTVFIFFYQVLSYLVTGSSSRLISMVPKQCL